MSLTDSTLVSSPSATQEAHDANGNGIPGIDLPNGLISIGEASRLFSLSICKIRLEVKAKRIECIRLPSGHRRFAPSSFLSYLGQGKQEKGTHSHKGLKIGLMARCSSSDQTQKNQEGVSQLDRQLERLREWAKKNHPSAHITEYVRQASGLNLGHKNLLQCLTHIMQHKLDLLVLTNTDRLVRYGREIIQLVCTMHNCKLVFIDENPDKTDEQELADDLLAIIHIFSCRKYGLRSGKNNQANPSPIILNKILTYAFKDKMSSYAITAKLKEDNEHLTSNGKVLSRRAIRRIIDENKQLAETFNVISPATSSGLVEFAKAHVRKTVGGKRNLLFSKLVRAYRSFCEGKGLKPVNNRSVERFLIKSFPDCPISKDATTGKRTIAGLWIHKS